MRRTPVIIQVAGHQYESDSITVGKNVLSTKLTIKLKEKYNFVRLVDLLDLNENYMSSLKLSNVYSHIYKYNCVTMEAFNDIMELISSHMQLKMMSGATDRIIVMHNSVYDLVVDLTLKYMLNFTSLYDDETQLYSVLKSFMDPKVNPFLIRFKKVITMYPADLVLYYHDEESITKPRGEFTSEDMQDIYDTLHKFNHKVNVSTKYELMNTIGSDIMVLNELCASINMEEKIDEFIELVISKVDTMEVR